MGNQKYSTEIVREIFAKEGFTLIGDYTDARSKVSYVCPEGHEGTTYVSTFIHKGTRCNRCVRIRSGKARRLERSEVEQRLAKLGITLVGEYVSNGVPMDCICKCGRHIKYYLTQTYTNQHCWHCRCDKMTGEGNPSFNPLISEEERAERQNRHADPGYRRWRNAVYRRDWFTCQCCFRKKGVVIHAHHIENYTGNREKRFDLENGITLCSECHIQFHKQYGFTNNNREQLAVFLSSPQTNRKLSEVYVHVR